MESGEEEKHNCLTWCEEHLRKIGIDISDQNSWLDPIVALPKYHLPDKSNKQEEKETNPNDSKKEEDLEPDSKINCLIM